ILAEREFNRIHLWDVASGQELHPRPGKGQGAFHAAYTPDGRFLATGTTGPGVGLAWYAHEQRTFSGLRATTANWIAQSCASHSEPDGKTHSCELKPGNSGRRAAYGFRSSAPTSIKTSSCCPT